MILSHHSLDFQRHLASKASNNFFVYYEVSNLDKYLTPMYLFVHCIIKGFENLNSFF